MTKSILSQVCDALGLPGNVRRVAIDLDVNAGATATAELILGKGLDAETIFKRYRLSEIPEPQYLIADDGTKIRDFSPVPPFPLNSEQESE